jgi:hypothetical protein
MHINWQQPGEENPADIVERIARLGHSFGVLEEMTSCRSPCKLCAATYTGQAPLGTVKSNRPAHEIRNWASRLEEVDGEKDWKTIEIYQLAGVWV